MKANPISLRLGYNKNWISRMSIAWKDIALYYSYNITLNKYITSYFENNYIIELGLIYSHNSISITEIDHLNTIHKKIRICIFIFDGRFNDYVRNTFKRFFSRLLLRKEKIKKKRYWYIKRKKRRINIRKIVKFLNNIKKDNFDINNSIKFFKKKKQKSLFRQLNKQLDFDSNLQYKKKLKHRTIENILMDSNIVGQKLLYNFIKFNNYYEYACIPFVMEIEHTFQKINYIKRNFRYHFTKRIYTIFYKHLEVIFNKHMNRIIFGIFKVYSDTKLCFIPRRFTTAILLVKYIIRKLMTGYRVGELIKPTLRYEYRSHVYSGIRTDYIGRLTRKQRASFFKYKRGIIGQASLSRRIDYASSNFETRYGACSIHVKLYK